MNSLKRERLANVWINFISLIGWLLVIFNLFYFQLHHAWYIFLILLIFLIFTEYYPLPVSKGYSSLSLPILYSIYIVFGLPVLVVAYALTVLIVNKLQHRPLRVLLFNPAQLVLSFIFASMISEKIMTIVTTSDLFTSVLIEVTFFVIFFYLINNFLVDTVLWIRPQPYRFSIWKEKFRSELTSFAISYFYILLMLFLGSQDRSHLDIFAAFFFFSPLVGLSLLSSSIATLKKEKNRLKSLFSYTQELNSSLPSKDWIQSVTDHLQELLDIQALVFFSKEKEEWKLQLRQGLTVDGNHYPITWFEELTVIADRKKNPNAPLNHFFDPSIKTMVYAPLCIDKECVGIIVVGRTRTHSFGKEDIRSIATIANQLAIILKTRSLISEQKQRMVLEERNRIARGIHDGVAQTLAGAIMKLEIAQKKFSRNPEEASKFIDQSLKGFRNSLKEVRESIYKLRPNPTERVGLKQAIQKRIETLSIEQPFKINFEIRGKPVFLLPNVEKTMFDTFQESMQNIIKHAKATKVDVLLSFQSEHVLLKIRDNGAGFSLVEALLKARNEPHFGLLSMNEEAEKIDATFQIDSRQEEGTEIKLIVPIELVERGELDD